MNGFWQTPEGQQLRAAKLTEEADLQSWLADQPGVLVQDHGGHAPEQWRGEVDGHNFSFRERENEWDIEIRLRPSGRSTRVVDGPNDDATTGYRLKDIIEGAVIATGKTGAEGYSANPQERAAFIVTTIRDYLRRERVDEVGKLVAERSAELNYRLS
ncbi:MAG: hypothetical protein PGN30_22105 [Mycolicibacterium neoaurum]|uniref:hypothetical protein n=1 Tax=Mycolicibacterium neoaurum TaxID=1795 RepID=UPI002FF5CFD4